MTGKAFSPSTATQRVSQIWFSKNSYAVFLLCSFYCLYQIL